MTLTFGSLFSGIGGMDLGLERAGMECAWQVEIDDFCTAVLARHWPSVPRYRDVRHIDFTRLPRVDVVAGGFPCQPFSAAGKRRGLSDERWLWPHFARAVRDLRPRWVLIENVPRLLSIESGRAAQAVLGDLSALGFDARWECLSAAAFGAPHLRERVFVVAHSERFPLARANGGGREGRPGGLGQGRWAEPEDGREPLADTLGPGLEEQQLEQVGGQLQATERGGDTGGWWSVEPDVDRVVDGSARRLDRRVHRIRALGNAVVPQVAEWVGGWIVSAQEAP
jgi:DNA (cytosine-5)-methyltransferase 1